MEQLVEKQEAVFEAADELERRMWQHIARRQEKINSNLDSLAQLFATFEQFDSLTVEELLQDDKPETKKRISQAENTEEKAKRQKGTPEIKPAEKVPQKKDRKSSGHKEAKEMKVSDGPKADFKGDSSDLRFEPFHPERFESNITTHIVKLAVTEMSHQASLSKLTAVPYKIVGHTHQAPSYYVKLLFSTNLVLRLHLTRPEPTMGKVTIVSWEEGDSSSVPKSK